jgi:ABC-type nitrate/sulfonate/bicarbonate transport system permease component
MVGRYGVFLVMLAGVLALMLGAWRLSASLDEGKQAESEAPAPSGVVDASAGPVEQAQGVALEARLTQAAQAGNVVLAQAGTFTGLSVDSLRAVDPTVDPSLVVVWSTPTDYCIQASQAAQSAHLQAARRTPEPGPCPA